MTDRSLASLSRAPLTLGRAAWRSRRLMRDQWRSPEEIRELQATRLRAIVRHAYENTEFYRRRFDEAGVSPEDIRGVEDLPLLPITRREHLREAEAMIAKDFDRRTMHRSTTSGSMVRPMTT